jgi:molybdenum cofactor biosynthesis enzyme MoaA
MKIELDRALTHTLNSLPRGRLHTGNITNLCNITSRHVTVDADANILLCNCDGWLPIPVGKVDDFDSLDAIWSSDGAKFLQQNISDKKFTWCAVEHCGILHTNVMQANYTLAINLDESCNLSCPSCRRNMKMLDFGPEYDKKSNQMQQIIGWLAKFERPIKITLTGNGDPLASKITRSLIQTYQPRPNQSFNLKTNGLLIKKLIESSPLKESIVSYHISVDAGSQAVYETVRRPGRWAVLLENLEWLKVNKGNALVKLDFIVQKNNLDDLFLFADLCKKFGFIANYSTLFDWGTWNSQPVSNPDAYTIANGTYLDHDVTNISHADHQKFVKILNDLHNLNFSHVKLHNFFRKFLNVTR